MRWSSAAVSIARKRTARAALIPNIVEPKLPRRKLLLVHLRPSGDELVPRRGRNVLALQFHSEIGEDERFNAWIEEWPGSVAEAGGDEASLRRAHDQLGPIAVAAGRAMIAEWLNTLD